MICIDQIDLIVIHNTHITQMKSKLYCSPSNKALNFFLKDASEFSAFKAKESIHICIYLFALSKVIISSKLPLAIILKSILKFINFIIKKKNFLFMKNYVFF